MSKWKEELPEELRAAPALADVEDIGSLAKQFVDQQAYLGTSIRIPSEEASDEDKQSFLTKLQEKVPTLMPKPDPTDETAMAAVYKALGRPESADDYTLPESEDIKIPDERAKYWKELAHSNGFTQKQFTDMLDSMMKREASDNLVTQTAFEESQEALKQEWGTLYDDRLKSITQLLEQHQAPEAMQEAVKTGTADPALLSWLGTVFQSFAGEGNEFSQQGKDTQNQGMLPAEATLKAAEIRAKLTSNEVAPSSPEYNALLKSLLKYEALAKPDASTEINDLRAGFSSKL